MQIKICGITNTEDALLCAGLGADALGFIFYERSKRFISYHKAEEIISQLPPFVLKVGVFVDEEFTNINTVANKIGLNAVQLHGSENTEYISNINLPVIKSFRVGDNFDWSKIDKYNKCQILLDSFSPNEMGGTGNKFDWNCIPSRIKNKIVLSGGISIANIDYIFDEIKPSAIDISSSIESVPGKKDHKKVKELFQKFNLLNSKKILFHQGF